VLPQTSSVDRHFLTPLGARAVVAIAVVVWLTAPPNLVAQDTLARAKDLYNTAAYDEALLVLNRLRQTAPNSESTEIAGYQAFCLLALGRTLDARQAISALVKSDPLYRLSEANSSPRMRAVFNEVRRDLLPGIVQQTYDQAKAAYDRKEPDVAVREFDRVLALLDEPGLSGLPNMEDLRRLATGFRDLSKAAATPPAPAASSVPDLPPTAPAAAPAPREPVTYSAADTGVVPPAGVSRPTPVWRPRSDVERRQLFRGILELLVNEQGDVVAAVLGKSVHPAYDPELLQMAKSWKFKPATKDGVPVKYRTTVEVRLGPR
jgi:TonB family protein